MPSQRRWRQRLLGSLQGQLQLATYLVVFAGFTGASTAGLWVGQRNLIHNETQTLRSSASAMQASLRSDQSARANANGANAIEQLQLELLPHSLSGSVLLLTHSVSKVLMTKQVAGVYLHR